VIQKPFRDGLSAQERRLVRRWTLGLFAFYGVVLAVTLTVAGLTHHPSNGSQAVASTQSTPSGDGNPLR